MSFGFPGTSMGGASKGPDLETIQTEASPSTLSSGWLALGFLSIAGDAKVRLTSSWSDLPAATSSLLSIASKKGLIAAAGPDEIILATTDALRKAFESPKNGDSDIRSFQPQLKIPMSMRVSQLVFTADENYLVLSAESGGGLAVYDVQSLLQGSSSSAFELSTNGESLRALVPNPTSAKAELVAIVTNGGNLHMANLRERSISGVIKGQVSCVSWSSKGKQLCAGLADGYIYQLTPEGEGKAEIPKPPGLDSCHVSSLIWLENNLFIAIYSTTDSPPKSVYQVITRSTPTTFEFQQMTDPIEPFGSEKSPHHTLLRLRDFPPDLQDLLIVASTASTEVGLLTRSKSPLANDKPSDSITKVFTTTELLDDTKRPTLPMTETMDDSTAVGIALDLSAKDKVHKPIPSDDELLESPGPLPGFWILTHEGILCSWWVVYTDSIRQGTTYPGLVASQGFSADQAPAVAPPTANPFSQSMPATSPFASSSKAPAFGASTQLGQASSPWAAASTSTPSTAANAMGPFAPSASTSAVPAFGKSSFGQAAQLGTRVSPWASGAASSATPAFGQSGFSSFADKGGQGAFGSSISAAGQTSTAAPASGGFAGFASQGGFASVANNNSASIFGGGSKPAGSIFDSGSADTAFPPKPSTDTIFGTPQSKASASIFATPQQKSPESVFGSTPFKLQSSFKPDPSATDDGVKTPGPSGSSMFGSAFGSALSDAGSKNIFATPSKDEDMDTTGAAEETPKPKPQFPTKAQSPESTTPTTTPAVNRFGGLTSPPPAVPLFSQSSKPAASTGEIFGNLKQGSPKTSTSVGLFGTPVAAGGESQAADKLSSPLSRDMTSEATILDSPVSPAKSTGPSPFGTPVSKPESAPAGHTRGNKSVSILEPIQSQDEPEKSVLEEAVSTSPDFVKVSKFSEPQPSQTPTATPVSKIPAKAETPSSLDSAKKSIFPKATPAPEPPSLASPKASSAQSSGSFSLPPLEDGQSDVEYEEEVEEGELDLEKHEEQEEDNVSEGSGVDVGKDLSPTITGATPIHTPQSSFGGLGGPSPSFEFSQQDRSRPLLGEVSRNAPVMAPRPTAKLKSRRTPSPMRDGLAGSSLAMQDASRSTSALSTSSRTPGSRPGSKLRASIAGGEDAVSAEDAFISQQRKLKERQEAEEEQLLVDEEDEERQRILASEIEPTLVLDEFIAHSNAAPPAGESIPSQVEALYRDINSMIDTIGLNARAVKAFIQGHSDKQRGPRRAKEDLEDPDDWVLCEINDLGEVLDTDLPADLNHGRVRNLADKVDACQDMVRDLQRLRAKQEDLNRIIMERMDPAQADISRSLPLSTEQATQQNELRREFTKISKALAEAEEALTLLKTRIASVSSSTGRGSSNVPTVDAVMRTISKMTSMAEKRSGDIDVLETQLRRMRLDSESREGSPFRTSMARRSIMSFEGTPSRARQSMSASIMSFSGSTMRTPTPRKKLSGFSGREKGELMEKRAKRQAVLAKLRESVSQKGVNVWTMENVE